ncbi:hypothetical protein [Aquimarina macrocephali]|uniref:hypothetical protein n=1 Tax=Aquimarina macrocephali TaxID=666563 RepID=UPI0004655890|nr:hypothetical protein [Aquimarina macrocephali]
MGILAAIAGIIYGNIGHVHPILFDQNTTEWSDDTKYQGKWIQRGAVRGGIHYNGQLSNIIKFKKGIIYYNDNPDDPNPTKHKFVRIGPNEYYNPQNEEKIRFTTDSTAVQEYCCDKGHLDLEKVKSN